MDPTTSILPQHTAAARSGSPPAVGQIRQWVLTSLLAEGDFSCIYGACPCGSSQQVPAQYALKVLKPEWSDHAQVLAAIRREAWVGRRISHPNVVPVLAASLQEPPYFVVMPLLRGRTLAEMGQPRQRSLDLPVLLWIARQVATALGALHERGWTHGDIKPSNIHASPEGHVTLLDLGFARTAADTQWAAQRPLMGTGQYLAPEALTSRLRPDIRSDLYSLGVVLYEQLAGRLPFEGETLAEVASQHQQAPPPPLRRHAPGVPPRLERLVHAMLAKEPLRRPQTPAEAVAELARLEIDTFASRGSFGLDEAGRAPASRCGASATTT